MTTGELERDERLILSELLNHVLDKGVVVSGEITISVADIDLLHAGVSLVLSSTETLDEARRRRVSAGARASDDDHVSVLPRDT